MEFYSYLWLREDGSPYYVGKGSGKRAFVRGSHHLRPPTDKARITIFPQDSEADAMQSEKDLIALFGRKDLGTGILRNLTDGGDIGPTGLRHLEDSKRRMSEGHKGRPSWNKGISPSEQTRAIWRLQRKGKNKGPRPPHVLAALHSPTSIAKSAATRTGRKCLEETKQKISQAHLGMKPSAKTLMKLRDSHVGQVPWNKGKTGGTWTAARRKAQEDRHHELQRDPKC